MSVRFVGPDPKMGPVPVDSSATLTRNQFVVVSSGQATAIAGGETANLAVSLENFPDDEYEGTRSEVDLAFLGEDCEIEVPFTTTGTLTSAAIGGAANPITAAGAIDVDSTTNGAFIVRRVGRETSIGDATGYVVGVITDAAAF